MWEDPTGWSFAVNEFDDDGMELGAYSNFEVSFTAICRYLDLYAPRGLVWRQEATGEIVELYSLPG